MNEQLIKKREEILFQMEQIVNKATTETRALNQEEITKYEELETEAKQIQKTIEINEKRSEFKPMEKEPKEDKIPTLADEIRGIKKDSSKILDIGNREVRTRTHTMTVGDPNGQPLTDIGKISYANYILDKLVYISPLYAAVRKERFGLSKHQIPVQANKLSKFVPMNELQAYAKNVATFEPILLEAKKFGTLIAFSDEAIEDVGYDLEAELLRQLSESYGLTLDELIALGNANGVQGLASFDNTDGSVSIPVPAPAAFNFDYISSIYYGLKIQYRPNGTWVMSDATAKKIYDLKDGEGRPLLITNYHSSPFGAMHTLLGRPVIINEFVGDAIYFGDLGRALVCGERKMLSLQRSEEEGFLTDEIYIKANMRLDIKKAITEAMVHSKAAAAGAQALQAKSTK